MHHYADEYSPVALCKPTGMSVTTLDVLARLGLAETREMPAVTVARITDAGREMLRSMGD